MARPRKDRIVAFNPQISYFKPRGIPLRELTQVELAVDEREAIRLADLLGCSHADAGKQMGVSRATFGRIVQTARQKIADALINGKAINVAGGNYTLKTPTRLFVCCACEVQWEEPFGTGRPKGCPACRAVAIKRVHGEQSD